MLSTIMPKFTNFVLSTFLQRDFGSFCIQTTKMLLLEWLKISTRGLAKLQAT